jgi:hypothetical protein
VFELRRRDFLALLGGTAAGISQAVPAEKNEIPTIGFLSARARDESSDLTAAFIRGSEADGFVAGRNLRVDAIEQCAPADAQPVEIFEVIEHALRSHWAKTVSNDTIG